MKIKYISQPKPAMLLFHEVKMDNGIIYFEREHGLKTYGVSSCIVFVAYYHNRPLCMLHWSTPASDEALQYVNDSVIALLQTIAKDIASKGIPLNEVTLYALGGQHSSYHAIMSLYIQSRLKKQPFNLNADHLFIAPYEDYFDLYISPRAATFWVVHHPVPVSASEVALANAQVTNSIETLALYCHELRKNRRVKYESLPINMSNNETNLSCRLA